MATSTYTATATQISGMPPRRKDQLGPDPSNSFAARITDSLCASSLRFCCDRLNIRADYQRLDGE
jgi:hypothetical protein